MRARSRMGRRLLPVRAGSLSRCCAPGSAAPAAVPRASSGSPAGTAAPPARPRDPCPTIRGGDRWCPRRRECMPSHGSPVALSRSGTVTIVKAVGIGGLELLPADGARHGGIGECTRAVGPRYRAVAVRLVEVDEDAVAAFFLPPGGGYLVGHAPLEFARRRDDGMPHVQELVGRLDRGRRRGAPGCLRS